MKLDVPRFMSIREVAKTGILSEYTLRLMEKQKSCPVCTVGENASSILIDLSSN